MGTNTVEIVGTDFSDEVSLLDVIDHVLNAGVVIRGSLVISLAGVDLIYLGLDVVLSSVETALRHSRLRSLEPETSLSSPLKGS